MEIQIGPSHGETERRRGSYRILRLDVPPALFKKRSKPTLDIAIQSNRLLIALQRVSIVRLDVQPFRCLEACPVEEGISTEVPQLRLIRVERQGPIEVLESQGIRFRRVLSAPGKEDRVIDAHSSAQECGFGFRRISLLSLVEVFQGIPENSRGVAPLGANEIGEV